VASTRTGGLRIVAAPIAQGCFRGPVGKRCGQGARWGACWSRGVCASVAEGGGCSLWTGGGHRLRGGCAPPGALFPGGFLPGPAQRAQWLPEGEGAAGNNQIAAAAAPRCIGRPLPRQGASYLARPRRRSDSGGIAIAFCLSIYWYYCR
jgi:hypothetical protein